MGVYEQDCAMDCYPSRLTITHVQHAREIGDGNFSLGVRTAIEIAYAVRKTTAINRDSNQYSRSGVMYVYPARLTAKHARYARSLGRGNLSEGVRAAIEIAFRGRGDR